MVFPRQGRCVEVQDRFFFVEFVLDDEKRVELKPVHGSAFLLHGTLLDLGCFRLGLGFLGGLLGLDDVLGAVLGAFGTTTSPFDGSLVGGCHGGLGRGWGDGVLARATAFTFGGEVDLDGGEFEAVPVFEGLFDVGGRDAL